MKLKRVRYGPLLIVGLGGLLWAISPKNSRTVNTGLKNLKRETMGKNRASVFYHIGAVLDFFLF